MRNLGIAAALGTLVSLGVLAVNVYTIGAVVPGWAALAIFGVVTAGAFAAMTHQPSGTRKRRRRRSRRRRSPKFPSDSV